MAKFTKSELETHAKEWEDLADQQENTAPGQARAATYRRAAESLRMEARTGMPHCGCCLKAVCCLKPGTSSY